MWSSRRRRASSLCRCPKAPPTWDLSPRVRRHPGRWKTPCEDPMKSCGFGSPRRWRRSSLRLRRHEVGRQCGAFAKEIFVHLIDEKFMGLRSAEIEAVLVHQHFHVLDPHFPRLFGHVVIDLLAQWMALERHLVKAFHFPLELDTKYLASVRTHRVLNLIKSAVTATHLSSILLEPNSQQHDSQLTHVRRRRERLVHFDGRYRSDHRPGLQCVSARRIVSMRCHLAAT